MVVDHDGISKTKVISISMRINYAVVIYNYIYIYIDYSYRLCWRCHHCTDSFIMIMVVKSLSITLMKLCDDICDDIRYCCYHTIVNLYSYNIMIVVNIMISQLIVNSHFRCLNWRYLSYIRPMLCTGYVGGSTPQIWLYVVLYCPAILGSWNSHWEIGSISWLITM